MSKTWLTQAELTSWVNNINAVVMTQDQLYALEDALRTASKRSREALSQGECLYKTGDEVVVKQTVTIKDVTTTTELICIVIEPFRKGFRVRTEDGRYFFAHTSIMSHK